MAGRGPDWLLGFGFTVKDKKLLTFLEQAETKFESLAKTIKKLNTSSAGKTGALDMSQFTDAFKPRGRGSVVSGLGDLEKAVASVVKHVDTGLQKVNATGRDISIALHKSILTLFDDVEAGAFKSAKGLSQLPDILLQIPGLSKDAETSLSNLFDELESGRGTHEDLVKTFKGLRNEIKKTVEESSGVELLEDRFGRFRDSVVDVFDILKPSSTEEIFSKAGKGLGRILSGDLFKALDIPKGLGKKDKKTFDEKQLEKYNEAAKKVANTLRAIGDIDPTQMRNVKRMTLDFAKRMATPASKLGKMFSRVPLINRLFGKKPDLKFMRQELGKVVKETQDWSDFTKFKEDKDQPGLPFQDFLTIRQTDIDKALDDTEMAFGDAVAKVQKELSEKGMPVWESLYEPGPKEAADQSKKLVDWAEQAFSPNVVNKAIQQATSGAKIDPLADLFEQGDAQTPDLFESAAKSVSDLWDKLKDGTALDAAVLGLGHLKDKISDLMVHGIAPLQRSVDEVVLSAKGQITDFGNFFSDWVEGQFSASFTKFRERISRSAKSFDNLTTRADIAFNNILLAKEAFVQSFESSFDRLSGKVGEDVAKISVVTEHEFRQLESGLRASYSSMEEISRRGVEQQATAIGRGFDELNQSLSRTQKSTVENLLERASALKKALGLNPFPVMATLSKLAPALARVGPAAARMGRVAAATEGAGAGLAEGGSFEGMAKEGLVDAAKERLTNSMSARMEQMSAKGEPERKEGGGTVVQPQSTESSDAVVQAVQALGTKFATQMGKMISILNKPPAHQTTTGKLKVDNDEMKKVLTSSIKTKSGLSGKAR